MVNYEEEDNIIRKTNNYKSSGNIFLGIFSLIWITLAIIIIYFSLNSNINEIHELLIIYNNSQVESLKIENEFYNYSYVNCSFNNYTLYNETFINQSYFNETYNNFTLFNETYINDTVINYNQSYDYSVVNDYIIYNQSFVNNTYLNNYYDNSTIN